MFNVSSDQIFKILLGLVTAASLSSIGYLTLVVIKINNIETKFEKQDELFNDVKIFISKKLEDTTIENTEIETTEQVKKTKLFFEKKLEEKTAEAQRLESLLKPFQTIAHQLFVGDEEVVLTKLIGRIITLENKVKKFVFKPLSGDIRTQIVKKLSSLKQLFKDNNISIELTHESYTPRTTRKYANQLALILEESGLNVTGPSFAKADLPDDKSYPLIWNYNKEQEKLVEKLYSTLNAIQSCRKLAAGKKFGKGRIRIHMAGAIVFDKHGRVSFD